MREFVIIWGMAIVAAVGYGVVHDQVTVRVCPEYFTVFHPDIGFSHNLTLLAAGWGVIATWWMGAILGLPLAIVARVGSLPPFFPKHLVKPLGILLAVMAVSALCAAIYGAGHPDPHAIKFVPATKLAAFTADWYAHHTSYFVGGWGGLVLCFWVWSMRRQLARVMGRRSSNQ